MIILNMALTGNQFRGTTVTANLQTDNNAFEGRANLMLTTQGKLE